MPVCQTCKIGVPPSYDTCPRCGNPLVAAAEPAAAPAEPPDAPVEPPDAPVEPPAVPLEAPEGASAYVTVTAPTTRPSDIAPPGVGIQVCSVCGRAPAMMLNLRRHMGLILFIRFTKLRAPFCRTHGEAAAREFLRRTMVEGWWGFLAVILNIWAISVDMQELKRVRQLSPPTTAAESGWVATVPEDVAGAVAETAEQRSARGAVLRTIATAIGLGVAAIIGVHVIAGDQTTALTRRIGIGIALALGVYVLVALLVARQLGLARVQPRAVEGPPVQAVLVGVMAGGGVAVVLGTIISLIAGRTTSDPNFTGVVFEGRLGYVVAIVIIAVLAAPIVEETLFRGLLVESLRSRGRTAAILGGAVAFSLWHLRPAQLQYYVLMGFLFGFIYWRFGLLGSISAHAAFNGVLVALAFVAVSGTSTVIGNNGVSAQLPGGWKEIHPLFSLGIDLAAESPVGAGFLIAHVKLVTPPGADMPRLPASPPPGATNERKVSVSGATATSYETSIKGVSAQIVLVPRGSNGYIVTLISGGSERARSQFDSILSSLTLPAG
jgi:membrane protease YdiL (CAAX protease family)